MPTRSGTLETNGARIYYEADGAGDPVVLIHAGVANLRMWDDQAEALRDSHRVIRHDTRGYGLTETDAVEFSNRADIAALLDHLGEESAHIVGLSRGGMIALDFAIEFPQRVRSLVIAAGGIGGYQSPDEADESTFAQAEAWLEAKDWESLSEWETAYWADGPGQPADRLNPALRARVHDWILTNYRAEKEEGQPKRLDPPAVGRLGELRAPLLVMLGTLDEPGTSESMRHLADAVPGARLETFEAAHMINLEHPERFNALLREHFAPR
ncbi:MAG TPA: alpha/beta fold hydrolase [Candidatus Limnocylindrales bacterium]|nr:alpha/beta fold hydrolase [Candidatus Limnocylindrales bacterium]